MAISELHMELATAARTTSYFLEPIKEAFTEAGLEEIEVVDNGSSIEIKSSLEGIDVLASQIAINLGLMEVGCVVIPQEESISLEFAWDKLETAGPLDFEDDEEVEDVPEDVDEALEEDEELEEDDKEKVKNKFKKGLEVLKTPESQKLVQRLYQLSNGDNIASFPLFWNDLDDLCLKYRKQSGYKPEEPDDLEEKASVLLEEIASDAMEELAKSKKWVAGRKGFLSALMKGIAQNGADIDKAWDDLDGDKIAALLEKVCYPVLDKIAQERRNRGMEDEASSDEETAQSVVLAKQSRPYYMLFKYDSENKTWEDGLGSYDMSEIRSERNWEADNGLSKSKMIIVTFKNDCTSRDVIAYNKRLNSGYKPKGQTDIVDN